MAAEIKDKLGFEIELIGGSGGIFDVHADGQLVYSKQQENDQFPEHQDLLNRLGQL